MDVVERREEENVDAEQPIRIADAGDVSVAVSFAAEEPAQERTVVVRNVKDARRLLARLIHLVQIGRISCRQAKDLAYLLTLYVSMSRDAEIDERLGAIESKINGIANPADEGERKG